MNSYQNLKVWQKSFELTVLIYNLTNNFPKNEVFGLTSQIKRSSLSVVSNIAEGSSRLTTKEFVRFLSMAYGSTVELHTQILLANKLKYISEQDLVRVEDILIQIRKMINALIRVLATKHKNTNY
jgi:four helix bundle protein